MEQAKKNISKYIRGYRTGCGYSLREWLEIKDKVKQVGSKEWMAYNQLKNTLKGALDENN